MLKYSRSTAHVIFFVSSCLFIYCLSVQSISTFGNEQNNSVTSQHGGFEISSSGLELAWKSVVDSSNRSYRRWGRCIAVKSMQTDINDTFLFTKKRVMKKEKRVMKGFITFFSSRMLDYS